MENSTAPEKRKWRLNLFDVIFIAVVVIAAVIIILRPGNSAGGVVSSGALQTVVYTIELTEMFGDTADLIKPGDSLVDKIERRAMGTVVSVDIISPARKLQKNDLTGGRVISEVPGRKDAVITVTADATVTDSQISIGGFIVRAGAFVSVNGPLYNGSGYIIDIERGEG